tara:strand:+ start:531 stop:1064 length:534 start_codon:yes stop_codon:yes gene_type:complete
MNNYLENTIQNNNINFIQIYFGDKISNNIFTMTDFNRESVLAKFKDNRVKQSVTKYYQAGNKIKEGKMYYKLVQIEDPDIVKDNVFTLNEDGPQAMVILANKSELPSHEFPCKLEYTLECTKSIIEIDYIETIKIKLLEEKNLLIEIVKDAYIDNTLRELETLIKELQCLFTDNSDN